MSGEEEEESKTLSVLKVNEGSRSAALQPELLPQPREEQLFLPSTSQPALPEFKSLTLGGRFLCAAPLKRRCFNNKSSKSAVRR